MQNIMMLFHPKKNFLGEWIWAFRSSTTIAPLHWTTSEDMNIALATKIQSKWGCLMDRF